MNENHESVIAEALNGIVEPGSSWVVRGIANEVLVEPYQVNSSSEPEFSPELTARIDSLNERLSSCGSNFFVMAVLAVAIACVGIHLNWFAGLLGPVNEQIQSVWFYLIALVASFMIAGSITNWMEKSLYRGERQGLFDLIRREGLSPSDVYMQIRDNEDLSDLVDQLKVDNLSEGKSLGF